MEEIWGFLEPWLDGLPPDWIRLDGPAKRQESDVWPTNRCRLEVTLPWPYPVGLEYKWGNHAIHSNPHLLDEFRKAREALALLAAVEHVDRSAWTFLLTNYCGVDPGKEGKALYEQDSPVRYFLVLTLREFDDYRVKERFVFGANEFCGVQQREDPSAEYLDALARIAALSRDKTSGVALEIPVRVWFQPLSSYGWTDEDGHGSRLRLAGIAQAHRIIRERWDAYDREHPNQVVPAGTFRCTFVLEPMLVDHDESRLTYGGVQAMQQPIVDDIFFSHVKIAVVSDGDQTDKSGAIGPDPQPFGTTTSQFATQIVGRIRRSPQLANTPSLFTGEKLPAEPIRSQLDSVHLTFGRDVWGLDIDAFLSAILRNQTARTISIHLQELTGDTRFEARVWKWLAYALFSKRRCLALERVELNGVVVMSREAMQEFAAVLTSDHPEEELFKSPRGQLDERDATLKGGAPIHWDLDNRGHLRRHAEPMAFESPIPCVRTFSDDGESKWVYALIPGLGRCQVQRSDLVFQEPSTSEPSGDGLLSLQLAFGIEDFVCEFGGLPLFLAAVGPLVGSLAINAVGDENDLGLRRENGKLQQNWLLRSCPNLRELTLYQGALDDVIFNFDEYHRKHQPIPAMALDCWNNISALLNTLCDGSNPLTHCLRQLHVDTRIQRVDSTDLIAALVEMLTVNKTLELLELSGTRPYLPYRDEIRTFHQKPINRIRQPVSIKAKLAFLSVTRSGNALPQAKRQRIATAARLPS